MYDIFSNLNDNLIENILSRIDTIDIQNVTMVCKDWGELITPGCKIVNNILIDIYQDFISSFNAAMRFENDRIKLETMRSLLDDEIYKMSKSAADFEKGNHQIISTFEDIYYTNIVSFSYPTKIELCGLKMLCSYEQLKFEDRGSKMLFELVDTRGNIDDCYELIKLLLEKCQAKPTYFKNAPFIKLAKRFMVSKKTLQLMIDHGSNINVNGSKVFINAILRKCAYTYIETLIQLGADVNVSSGRPLMLSTRIKDVYYAQSIAYLLLINGADPTLNNNVAFTNAHARNFDKYILDMMQKRGCTWPRDFVVFGNTLDLF